MPDITPIIMTNEEKLAEQQVIAAYLAFSDHLRAYTTAQMQLMGATLRATKEATEVTLPPPLKLHTKNHTCKIRYLCPSA